MIQTAAAESDSRLDRFQERLTAVGGRCWIAQNHAEASAILNAIVTDAGARSVIRSDAELLASIAPAAARVQDVTREDLLACDVGVTTAQWAIAETGTLVLESARERHRLLSLLPRVHVAFVDFAHLCDTMGEALARIRGVDEANVLVNRAVTFITGPSRTSDIELTLVIGVHGPQALHVIVLLNS